MMRRLQGRKISVLALSFSSSLLVANAWAQEGEAAAPPAADAPAAEAPAEQAPAAEAPAEQAPANEAAAEAPADEAEPAPAEAPEAAAVTGASTAAPPDGTPPEATPPDGTPGESSDAAAPASGAAGLSGPASVAVDTPPPVQEPTAQGTSAEAAPASAEDGYDDGYDDEEAPAAGILQKEDPKFQVAFGWDMSLPFGNTKDFVNKFGIQGFSVDFRYLGLGRLQLGGMIAWHTMAGKRVDTMQSGAATLTGTMYREFSATPMVAKVTYAHLNEGKVIPYASFGAGGARVVRRVDVGIAQFANENWQWAMVPEVGVMVPAGPVTAMGALRYNILIAGAGQPTEQYMNFMLGIGLR